MGEDPGTRGTLTIRNKAAGRIVERAALDVPGVVRSDGRFGALTGRRLPRAIVDMAPEHPNIRVDIAVGWPMPIAAVCAQVQRRVAADLERFTDRRPSRVDISVTEVIADGSAEGIADTLAHAHAAPENPTVPLARPLAVYAALVVGVALVALGVIAGREFLIEHNGYGGPPLVRNSVEWVSRVTWQPWFLPVSVAALLGGLMLLAAALLPRRRTHVDTAGNPRLWLRTTDVARLSTAAALHVDGVRRAVTDAGRRNVRVRVVQDTRSPDVTDAVQSAVTTVLADLSRRLDVRVDVERPPAEGAR